MKGVSLPEGRSSLVVGQMLTELHVPTLAEFDFFAVTIDVGIREYANDQRRTTND